MAFDVRARINQTIDGYLKPNLDISTANAVALFRHRYLFRDENLAVHGLLLQHTLPKSFQATLQLAGTNMSANSFGTALNVYGLMRSLFRIPHQVTSNMAVERQFRDISDSELVGCDSVVNRGIENLLTALNPLTEANRQHWLKVMQFYLNLSHPPLGLAFLVARMAGEAVRLEDSERFNIIHDLELRSFQKAHAAGQMSTDLFEIAVEELDNVIRARRTVALRREGKIKIN